MASAFWRGRLNLREKSGNTPRPESLQNIGVFGSFTYYLPELFPTRIRATGSGFCYNGGRIITAVGPFVVGYIASQKANSLQGATEILFLIGFVPLLGAQKC